MLPRDDAGRRRAEELMRLERALFGDWCGYVFQVAGPCYGRHAVVFTGHHRPQFVPSSRRPALARVT